MAKHLVQNYTFIPSQNKVTLHGNVQLVRLLLITNVTSGIILYNFADDQVGATVSYDNTTELTTVVLEKNFNQMYATDTLQIFYEKDYVEMEPSETFVDPVSKFRVSTPQNLVDTDFEYGPQSSKWETIQLINNIPSFYSSTSDTTLPFIESVSTTAGSELVTVTTTYDHGLTAGIPITVAGLSSLTAEGAYLVQSVPTTKTFTYKGRAAQTLTRNIQGTYTSIIPGQFYQGSQIAVDNASGIVADQYTRIVTGESVTPLTLTQSAPVTWQVGQSITNGTVTAIITKINSTIVSVCTITGGSFSDGNTLSVVGTVETGTIATAGVGAAAYEFFIDGIQQPNLLFSTKAVYIFDLSSTKLSGHLFALSTTSDGTNNAGTEYTTYVLRVGTAGSAGAYLRIYITTTTPNLYYYCGSGVGHENEGGDATVSVTTSSKVYLKTQTEHGFSDNTNFYFVNTVSPKVLDVTNPVATAPDLRPYIDFDETKTPVTPIDVTQTVPYNYESTYTLRFGANAVNYADNSITIPAHGLHNSAAMLYYPNPGDIPITGLNRMSVYYIQVVDVDTIKLHESQRLNILIDLQNTSGTFTFGSHNLGFVYNTYREYKAYGDYYAYFYTYYWSFGGTYSGYDFTLAGKGTYGIGSQAWDITVPFSISRPGYGSSNFYVYNYAWYYAFGTTWRTYGYHLQALPLGTSAQFQGVYDFLTDHENYGVNGDNNGGYSYGYSLGGYQHINPKTYWTTAFSGYDMNSNYLRIYGGEYYYWYLQGYYYSSNDRYFGAITSDGSTNMYFMLAKRNTSTNDSFYSAMHGWSTNDAPVLTSTGGGITFWSDVYGAVGTISSGSTVYIEKIDDNRFRIKSSTGAVAYRIRSATGTASFSATVANPTKNSIYIANNLFSNNEVVTYTFSNPATIASGITSGTSYYVKALDGNRFQLGTTVGFTTEVNITSTGSGIQTFENSSASFGVVDGSYTTTRVVDEKTLEVSLPFKIGPGTKAFNATSNVVTGASGYITITNHFFSTGTRVIYDNKGGTSLGGLTNNFDYYVIVLDDTRIRLATSAANAVNGTAITITTQQTGVQNLITNNLSGLITGAGTVSITTGSRTVTGSGTAFKRYYKIGDTFQMVNSTTTPGTLITKTISAIKDDTSLLVDSTFSVTRTGEKFFVPSYIYVRPDGFFLHRPFDGGMEMGTSKSPNGQISRQTRKYFRYQSGKGIQTSFAINFVPQIPISLLTYSPLGTQTTKTISGTSGSTVITVNNNTGLILNMPVTGTGIGTGARIIAINGNIITLSKSCIGNVSGTGTFGIVKYVNIQSQKTHNILVPGLNITVTNTNFGFDGDYEVVEITDEFNVKYIASTTPSQSTYNGGGSYNVHGWANSCVRAGMFDQQNGFFFEYDGGTLNCVRRSSVAQISGLLSVTKNSGSVTGTNTKFTSQLVKGDNLVIRGMSYKVVKISNDTTISIQPAYRGITSIDVIGTRTVDTKVPRVQWSIDPCDGTGPSGYVIDETKIQMCYADYSWYGAGKIRFGVKDQNGHVKYVHEFRHNNKLQESYFRSGNLPARYEVINIGTPTYVPSLFHWGTSVIMDGMFQDDEAYLFTASGDVLKYTNAAAQTASTNANSTIAESFLSWSASQYYIRLPFATADASKLTISTLLYNDTVANKYFLDGQNITSLTRTEGSTYAVYILYKEGTTTVFPRNYASIINAKLGNPAVPTSTSFNIGAKAAASNLIPQNIPLISIRLAPSVDSSITGSLGQREIINRMQLALEQVGVLTTHESEISLILNPSLSTDAYENASNPSLSQLIKHSAADTIAGGQQILSFRASGGGLESSRRLTASTTYDLTQISSLGNSIIGGDGVFPNGPDILTVVANCVDSTGVSTTSPYSVTGRITWKESQA